MELSGEKLQLRYITLDQVVLWDENRKKYSIDDLIRSIERYSHLDPDKYEPSSNAGNDDLKYDNI